MCFRFRLTLIRAIALLLFAGRAAAAQEIPFEFRDGLIWVKVRAAGSEQALNFLLDSGAGCSVVDLGAARRLRMRLGQPERVQRVQSETGACAVCGFRASAGGVPISSTPLAMDLSQTSAVCSRRIDGLIGQDFFRGRIVQIDFRASRIRLLDRHPAREVCCVLPLSFCNDAMCVPIAVNGSGNRLVRIDTGCDEALFWVDGASKASKFQKSTFGFSTNRPARVQSVVQLGPETIRAVKTLEHQGEIFPGESGLLGNGLLARYRVTIDAIGRRVFLER